MILYVDVLHDRTDHHAPGFRTLVLSLELLIGAQSGENHRGNRAARALTLGNRSLQVVLPEVRENFLTEGTGIDAAIGTKCLPPVENDREADHAAKHQWDHQRSTLQYMD